jgi:hypothetical protein
MLQYQRPAAGTKSAELPAERKRDQVKEKTCAKTKAEIRRKQRQHTKKLAQDQTAHEQNLAATKRYKQRKITKDEIRRKPRQHTKKLAQAVHHTNKILQRPRDTNREKSQISETTDNTYDR